MCQFRNSFLSSSSFHLFSSRLFFLVRICKIYPSAPFIRELRVLIHSFDRHHMNRQTPLNGGCAGVDIWIRYSIPVVGFIVCVELVWKQLWKQFRNSFYLLISVSSSSFFSFLLLCFFFIFLCYTFFHYVLFHVLKECDFLRIM